MKMRTSLLLRTVRLLVLVFPDEYIEDLNYTCKYENK